MKESQKSNGYSLTTVYHRKKWNRFWPELVNDSFMLNSMKQFMTTRLPRRLFRRAKHIMALDCDSYNDMRSATGSLFFNQISHCVIESSPGRYWVIADRVGRVKELYPLMMIAGVDRDYVRFTDYRESFHLRAYPKNGFIPRQVGIWMSRDINSFRTHTGNTPEHYRLYREWLSAFLDYWNSSDMRFVAGNLRTSTLDNGGFGELRFVSYDGDMRWELFQPDVTEERHETEMKNSNLDPKPNSEPEPESFIEINNCLDCMEI